MNTDVIEGKWKQVRGQVKEWWADLTDDDLNKVAGKSERLVGLLQERYGYSRQQAQEEINDRIAQWKNRNNNNEGWSILSGILIGALIGAVVMLFLAPQSGKKTIKQLRRKGSELREYASDTAEDLQNRASDAMYDARSRVKSARKNAESVADDVRDAAQKARKQVEAGARRARKATEDALS
jgi:gas vesicle protein